MESALSTLQRMFREFCAPELTKESKKDGSKTRTMESKQRTWSNWKNSARSSALQFRPTGQRLSIPVRNSINVPLQRMPTNLKTAKEPENNEEHTAFWEYPDQQYNADKNWWFLSTELQCNETWETENRKGKLRRLLHAQTVLWHTHEWICTPAW